MATQLKKLPENVKKEYKTLGPKCPLHDYYIQNLSDYFAAFDSVLSANTTFWFRGHSNLEYQFTPSALRYTTVNNREKALNLTAEFRRFAEIKLPKSPDAKDELKWLQLAQHYGLPTRLLDWTENAAAALYFACKQPNRHGLVGVLNPRDLNRTLTPKKPRIFNAHVDADLITPYLKLKGKATPNGRPPIAILPIMNSERIILQKGVFTLHGSPAVQLEGSDTEGRPAAPLMYMPILKDVKPKLTEELDRIGINEMSLFPELEHVCAYLKKKANLN